MDIHWTGLDWTGQTKQNTSQKLMAMVTSSFTLHTDFSFKGKK